jgi:hypothetical protein
LWPYINLKWYLRRLAAAPPEIAVGR